MKAKCECRDGMRAQEHPVILRDGTVGVAVVNVPCKLCAGTGWLPFPGQPLNSKKRSA